MTNNNNMTNLQVSIKSKNAVLFNGYASTITSKNERGVFDVLPLHTNFITLVSNYIIIDKGLSSEKKFEIEKGVLYIIANRVDIHIGI